MTVIADADAVLNNVISGDSLAEQQFYDQINELSTQVCLFGIYRYVQQDPASTGTENEL